MQVIREIGRGGFGLVEEVRDGDGAPYARKSYRFNQPFKNTPEVDAHLKRRFDREARLQSGISHRNVVPIVSKHLDCDPPYFLMPLASSSLEDDIRANKTLNGAFVGALMDIIAALEELHPLRIYHRDLKPGNVLKFQDAEDQRGYYYAISDFGLVALKQTQVSMLTQVGMKMTSDFYTAPEITQDLSRASPQSDIYSVGCIIHDFVGTQARIPCGEINEDGEFGAIMLNCTRRDPTRRFKSVTALRDVLLSATTSLVGGEAAPEPGTSGALLASEAELTVAEWAAIVDDVERNSNPILTSAILRKLTIVRIQEIFNKEPALAARLATRYSEWVRDQSFNFNDCDGTANRLEAIFDLGDVSVQAEAVMAMLYMGTSHNRWYVERKFVSLVGKLNDVLAKRIAVVTSASLPDISRLIVTRTMRLN